MASYAITGRQGTLASTYKTALNAFTTTSMRFRIDRMDWGFESTPADNTVFVAAQRTSAVGTEGAGVVPAPFDVADPASIVDGAENHSAEPTFTSATEMVEVPLNQRAAFSWMAIPGKEIVVPATNNAGLAMIGKAAAYTGPMAASMQFTQG